MTVSSIKQGRNSRDPVCTLGAPLLARQLAAGAASANTVLSTTAWAISIRAVTADIRFSIGSTSQTASATSHFIAAGERLQFRLGVATPNIGVIRAGGTDGVLEVTELQ